MPPITPSNPNSELNRTGHNSRTEGPNNTLLSKIKMASGKLVSTLRKAASNTFVQNMRARREHNRVQHANPAENNIPSRLETTNSETYSNEPYSSGPLDQIAREVPTLAEFFTGLERSRHHFIDPNECLNAPSNATGIADFRTTPLGKGLVSMLNGKQSRNVDIAPEKPLTHLKKNDLVAWCRATCNAFTHAKNRDTPVHVLRNQTQLDQLLSKADVDSNGDLKRETGVLLQDLALGAIIIIDEQGFSAAELEGLNELKQNGTLGGIDYGNTPPFIINIVDTESQKSGLRSGALASRADYQRIPVNVIAQSQLPTVYDSEKSPLTPYQNNNFVTCNGDDWKNLSQPKPSLTESGWVLTQSLIQQNTPQNAGLVFVSPPIDDPHFLDFLYEIKQAGIEYTLVNEMPKNTLQELMHNKEPNQSTQTPIVVDTHNLSSFLAKATLVSEQDQAFFRPGLFQQKEAETLAIHVSSPLNKQQWQDLLCAPRSLAIEAASGIDIPKDYRHLIAVKAPLLHTSAQHAKAPGLYRTELSTTALKSLTATSNQSQVFVTPEMSISDLFAQWTRINETNGIQLNNLSLAPKQMLQDLQSHKQVFIHGLEKNPELAGELLALSGPSGQLNLGGHTFCWAGTELPQDANPLPMQGQIIVVNTPSNSALADVPKWQDQVDEPEIRPAPKEDLQRYTAIIGEGQARARLLKDNRCLFLQGPPGVGKTHQANHIAQQLKMKAINISPQDIGTPRFAQQLLKWVQTSNETPGLLIIDEANIAPEGTFDFLKEFLIDNTLLIDGQRHTVPIANRVIFTGNSDTTEGRVKHELIQNYSKKEEISQLNTLALEKNIAEPVRATLATLASMPGIAWESSHIPTASTLKNMNQQHRHLAHTPGLDSSPRLLRQYIMAFTTARAQGLNEQQAQAAGLKKVYADAAPLPLQKHVHQYIEAITHTELHKPNNIEFLSEAITQTTGSKELASTIDHWLDDQDLLTQARSLNDQIAHTELNTEAASINSLGTRALLIEGPAGRGKDQIVIDRLKQRMSDTQISTINMSSDIDLFEEKLIDAVVTGKTLVVSELNLAPSAALESTLNPILNGEEIDIKVHPKFRFIATVNPSDYIGRRPLSDALTSRMNQVKIGDYGAQDLREIAQHAIQSNRESQFSRLPSQQSKHVEALIQYHTQLTTQLDKAGQKVKPTTREVIQVAQALRQHGQTDLSLDEFEQLLDQSYGYYKDSLELQSHGEATQKSPQPHSDQPKFEQHCRAVRHLLAPQIPEPFYISANNDKPHITQTADALTYSGPIDIKTFENTFNSFLRAKNKQHKAVKTNELSRIGRAIGDLKYKLMNLKKPQGQVLGVSQLQNTGYIKLGTENLKGRTIGTTVAQGAPLGQDALTMRYKPIVSGLGIIDDNLPWPHKQTLMVPTGYKVESALSLRKDGTSKPVPVSFQKGLWTGLIPTKTKDIELKVIQDTSPVDTNKNDPKIQSSLSSIDLSLYPELEAKVQDIKEEMENGSHTLQSAISELNKWMNNESDFRYSLDYEDMDTVLFRSKDTIARNMLQRRSGKCSDYAALGARIIAQEFDTPARNVFGHKIKKSGDISSVLHEWTEFYDKTDQAWHTVDFTVTKPRTGLPETNRDEQPISDLPTNAPFSEAALPGKSNRPSTSGLASKGTPSLLDRTYLMQTYRIARSTFAYNKDTKVLDLIMKSGLATHAPWIQQLSEKIKPLVKNLPKDTMPSHFNSQGRGQIDMNRMLQGNDDYFKASQSVATGTDTSLLLKADSDSSPFSTVFASTLLRQIGIFTQSKLSQEEDFNSMPSCSDQTQASQFLQQVFYCIIDAFIDEKMDQLKYIPSGQLQPISQLSIQQKLAFIILHSKGNEIETPALITYQGTQIEVSFNDAVSITPYLDLDPFYLENGETLMSSLAIDPEILMATPDRQSKVFGEISQWNLKQFNTKTVSKEDKKFDSSFNNFISEIQKQEGGIQRFTETIKARAQEFSKFSAEFKSHHHSDEIRTMQKQYLEEIAGIAIVLNALEALTPEIKEQVAMELSALQSEPQNNHTIRGQLKIVFL